MRFAHVAELLRNYGYMELVRRILKRGGRTLREYWCRLTRNRSYVFVHDGTTIHPIVVEGLVVLRFTSLVSMPADVSECLAYGHGEAHLAEHRRWMERGAVLWVGLLGGKLAGSWLSCSGRYLPTWFVPLESHDIVIFRNNTLAAFRGRGITPAAMQHIMSRELADGGRAYVDCKVYNKPSIRSIEKTGFRLIATMRPLRRRGLHD